ncbi:MAG: RDD family protein [Minicystis sp.]
MRALPPLAGFWRRFAAWFIDLVFLGVIGQALGWALASFWFRVGPDARVVGLLVLLAYFGVMGSRVTNGQTLGKRLLKIAVRDADGKPIGVGRALLRAAFLVVPYILNGWASPVFEIGILSWIDSVVVFGMGGAILYTMLFNRRARQGLHDLICNTYVVRLGGEPVASFPATGRAHWIVVGVLVALAAAGTAAGNVFAPSIMKRTEIASLDQLSRTLKADGRFFTVSANDLTMQSSQGGTSRILQVQVWYKGRPSEAEAHEIMKGLAKVVLESTGSADRYDLLRFSVTSAFDLGIASSNHESHDGEPPDVWRQRLGSGASP